MLKVYPPLKLKVFVDDIKHHLWRMNQEVPGAVPTVVGKFKMVSTKQKWKLSLTEGRTEGRSKLVASNKCLQSELCGLCEKKESESHIVWNIENQTKK